MQCVLYQRFFSVNLLSTRFLTLLMCFFISSTSFSDEGFPGRKQFPQIQTISIEKLYEKIVDDKVIVVDVRSEYEFQTLKILNAINIPVSQKSFPVKLKELRDSSPKEIVFYCNGRACYKSYKAGIKALNYNVKNCVSYDAGVFEWALAHSDQAVLLGQSPINKESIISKDDFKLRLLAPKDFEQNSLGDDNSLIYDIRDREQRRGSSGIFMFRDKNVELDNTKKLRRIIQKAIDNDSTVYFYDQKGKQVRWLQYTLEAQGLENYYFMKGGAGAYYKMLRKEQK